MRILFKGGICHCQRAHFLRYAVRLSKTIPCRKESGTREHARSVVPVPLFIMQQTNVSLFPGISGSTLKMIAIISMLIDHAGATVIRTIWQSPVIASSASQRQFWSELYRTSRSIGRIAFPIFCFLIVEGFLHTRNVWCYARRLFLFSLISEIPFDLALKGNWYYPEKQNVYFTLLIGLLVLIGLRFFLEPQRRILHWLWPLVLITGMYAVFLIDTDYNYKGVFLIAMLYLLRRERFVQCIGCAVSVAWEMPAPIAAIPIYLYNGTRGRQMTYVFYWFYPVHLLVLYGIAQYLIPAIL